MKYLITGGTGSFGSRYTKHLLELGHDVRVFSRNEYAQWQMKQRLPDAEYIIGDVRDKSAVLVAARGVDRIVHTAALKHVHTGQVQPWETIQTNVHGTKNVVDAANLMGAGMVLLSTDKAVEPVNLYGASKMAAETITITGGQRVVRYGNVLGSRGSVLHIFQKQAAKGHVFSVTDRRMTRFVVTFSQAIRLVDEALNLDPGSVHIPTLKALRIVDLVRAFDDEGVIEEIGIFPGEKLHEKLTRDYSSEEAEKLTVDEIREVIHESLRDS